MEITISKLKRKTIDLKFCIICQKPSSKQLTSTENGKEKVIEGSLKLGDNLFRELTEEERNKLKYHLTCYKPYVLSAQRMKNYARWAPLFYENC